MSKKITIDSLGIMIQESFLKQDKKLAKIESTLVERFDNLEEKVEDIKSKLDYKADQFEVNELKRRTTRVERRLRLPLE